MSKRVKLEGHRNNLRRSLSTDPLFHPSPHKIRSNLQSSSSIYFQQQPTRKHVGTMAMNPTTVNNSSIGGKRTFFGGIIMRATTSGRINNVTSHPHANNFKEMSCQNATNVNTANVLIIGRLLPPKGIYIYRIIHLLKLRCHALQKARAE